MSESSRPHLLGRAIAALAGGGMLAASFPPLGLWWCAPIAVALICFSTITTRRLRGAFGWGFFGGFVFFLLLLSWIRILGPDAWIVLGLVCALWFGLLGVLARLLVKLPYWPLWIAAAWVAQEALRGRIPYGGFPWGRLAYSQGSSPTIGFASLAGAAFVTFVIALMGALLCWAAMSVTSMRKGSDGTTNTRERVTTGRTPRIVAGALALVLALGTFGLVIPKPTEGETTDGPAVVTVALIQGGVPGAGLSAMSERRAVLNNHVRQTKQLAADVAAGKTARPELVIWPENSSDIDPFTDLSASESISEAARAIGVPILVGAVINSPRVPGTLWNVGIVWDPVDGPSDYYVKRHPVPFGEYIPGRSVLQRFISRFDLVPFDFSPGEEPGVLQVGPARLADVICFEVAYDDVVRDAVLGGGRAISVQTNNATYTTAEPGGAAQSQQQAAMSQVRAVEHGRAVMIAATSGITAFIDPAGRVVEQAPILDSTYLVAAVPLRDSVTVADRLGSWPELLVFLAALSGVSLAVLRHRRPTREHPSEVDGGRADLGDRDR